MLPAPYQNVPERPHFPVLASTKKGNCESHHGLSQLWHGSKKPLYGLQLLRWAAPSGGRKSKSMGCSPPEGLLTSTHGGAPQQTNTPKTQAQGTQFWGAAQKVPAKSSS